jgi:8-oxo-dGTP diphosphatase
MPRARKPTIAEPPPASDGFPTLTTERLTLRAWDRADEPALLRLLNNWNVVRWLSEVPYAYRDTDARDWVAHTRERLAAGDAWQLAITRQLDGRETVIGGIGLTLNHATRSGRLGYWLDEAVWGQRIGSEAVGRFVSWAFATLEIERIDAAVITENPASAAILRRLGFRHTGDGEMFFRARSANHPVWRFSATREDLAGVGPAKPVNVLLVVACALLDAEGRILLARRPEGKKMAGLWEFPGGKVNPGETPEAALIRELREELGIDVTAACLAPFTFASHAYADFHLLMPLYLCRRWKGTPVAREGQTLAWVRPARLADYPMPPADLPLIPLLRDFL